MLCSRGAFHFKITMHYTALIWGSQTLFGIRDFNSTSWNKSGGLNVMGVANQVFSLCFWTSQWTRTQKGLVRTQILLPVQPYKAESLWREFGVGALKRSFVFVYVHEITLRCLRLVGYLEFCDLTVKQFNNLIRTYTEGGFYALSHCYFCMFAFQ